MSLRKRLIVSIALLLAALWLAAVGWFLLDVRAELRQVLDARLASSARMVQGLLARGDLQLDPGRLSQEEPGELEPLPVLPTQVACQLWTLDGNVVTFSDDTPPLTHEPEEDGLSTQLVDGQLWRVFTLTDTDTGIRIATAERQSLRTVLVRDVALAVTVPFLLALPGMGLVIWFGVGRGLSPLERLRNSIASRHADALDPLPEQDIPVEVAPLVRSLNGLFMRLTTTLERERRFTGDAAHELRTPLAGIKTQLQIAQAADGEVRARALSQAEVGLDRMSRLVAQLLTLARLESPIDADSQLECCDPHAVVRETVRELEPAAVARGVSLRERCEQAVGPVAMPASLLHAALRNLLENAIRHSPAGATVTVSLEHMADGAALSVIDEGGGLSEEEVANVTRRFYRAKSGATNGSGLGLSIVEAICERHGARLRLKSCPENGGLVASLQLRPAPASILSDT